MKIQIGKKKEQEFRLPWERSEALYHMHETGYRKSGEKPSVTGMHEAKEGKTASGRMRETFRAENSYGNIALGVNKKKEAAFVMSQKREHNGPVTPEAKKNLHMERKRREAAPLGNFYMNPDLKQKGAVAFQAKLSLPSKKVMEQIRQYDAKAGSQMMEKRMPYLGLDKERRQLKALGEHRRKSRERREGAQAEWYDVQIQRLQNRIGKQEQDEKQMMRKLRDEWQKAKKVYSGSFEQRRQMEADAVQGEKGQMETGAAQEEEQEGKAYMAQEEGCMEINALQEEEQEEANTVQEEEERGVNRI